MSLSFACPPVSNDTPCATRHVLSAFADSCAIGRPDAGIAVGARELPGCVVGAVGHHLGTGPRLVMARGTVNEIAAVIDGAFVAATQPLLEDVLELARLYRMVSGHHALRVRLERVTTDSCRKFHVDCVDLRLLCAYHGPGVQWTRDGGAHIDEAATGTVVLLKGKHAPGWREEGAILHRSPPLSSRPEGERTRLLLTVDAADACGMSAEAPVVIAA